MLTTISLVIIHHHTKLVSFLVMRMFKIRSLSESKVAQSCLTLCDPMDCSLPGSSVHGIFLGKSTGVGCHLLLQEIFPTQGSNLGLPYCRQMLYHLSHQGSPIRLYPQQLSNKYYNIEYSHYARQYIFMTYFITGHLYLFTLFTHLSDFLSSNYQSVLYEVGFLLFCLLICYIFQSPHVSEMIDTLVYVA